MRVSQVNTIQTFKGLWSKTTIKSDFDDIMGVLKITKTTYYHPFKNETPDEIKSVIEANKNAYIDEPADEKPKYYINECKQCTKLPFDASAYKSYVEATSSTRLSPTLKMVNFYVADKYKNNKYGDEQIPAINGTVDYKINKVS